eukprot:3113328-Alexandrium_andersonii.AAC.1
MSASLVGSEMCIRDSPCHTISTMERRPQHNRCTQLRRTPPQTPTTAPPTCLLYTSDAADDM